MPELHDAQLAALDDRYLAELADAEDGAPCLAVWGAALLRRLNLADDGEGGQWRKLAGRPSEKVRALGRDLREARPEVRQHLVTRFAKECPAAKRTEGT